MALEKSEEDAYLYDKGPEVVKGLIMLGIVTANDIEGDAADGILGLGPMKTLAGRGHFVTALKEQGLIEYEIFSFDFKPQNEKSKMIFGDIDTKIVSNFHDIIWVPIEGGEEYWNLPLRSTSYGDNQTLKNAKYAVIDTGSSTMALAEDNFLELMQSILDTGLECGFFIDEKFVACAAPNGFKDFPVFTMNINGHLFDMDPEDYLACEDDICVILVYNLGDRVVVDRETIVLGVNFLRKYYTVFDIEKSRVGIYGHKINAKTSAFEGLLFLSLIALFVL